MARDSNPGATDGNGATASDLTPVGRARSGAPAAGEAVADRFSTDEIFQRVVATAFEAVEARARRLYLSGLAAGFAITITFLAYATLTGAAGPDPTGLVGPLLYPLGFVYIIVGRYQLYTENTLTPMTLVLTRVTSVPSLLRVWLFVLAGNLTGALIGAFVLARTGVFDQTSAAAAATIGQTGIAQPVVDLFFKGTFAGWLVAGMVWLEHAVQDSISRVLLVFLVIYTIPVTGLYHVVVSACDVFYLVFTGQTTLLTGFAEFVVPVLLGNTVGGVFLVALLNYGQTSRRLRESLVDTRRLGPVEWLLGRGVGRSQDDRDE